MFFFAINFARDLALYLVYLVRVYSVVLIHLKQLKKHQYHLYIYQQVRIMMM